MTFTVRLRQGPILVSLIINGEYLTRILEIGYIIYYLYLLLYHARKLR